MSPLRNWWRRPPAERRLLLHAVALVSAVRIMLPVAGFPRVRRVLAWWSRGTLPRLPLRAEQIDWAVRAAARRIPGARTCLVEALAAQALLARHGVAARLRIGVTRDGPGIAAHAWLERDGRPVFGRPTPGPSSLFPPLEPLSQ